MSKQAFAVRQGERELGCLWKMETIRVNFFHVSSGSNFSTLLSNGGKRCQRVRDEVSTVFIKLRRYTDVSTDMSADISVLVNIVSIETSTDTRSRIDRYLIEYRSILDRDIDRVSTDIAIDMATNVSVEPPIRYMIHNGNTRLVNRTTFTKYCTPCLHMSN